jgi:hypothetical protein
MRTGPRSYRHEVNEPGSPVPFPHFCRWCRSHVALATAAGLVPQLLFADGPRFDETIVSAWEMPGRCPDTVALAQELIPAVAAQTGASQVALAVPFGGPAPGVTFICVDETESVGEEALVDLDRLRLELWLPVEPALFPISDWQQLLARNAGYREFAKWRCRHCRSVCPGEAANVPTPCDFCASTDIERVSLETALRAPDPPYRDETAEAVDAVASPFIDTILAIIDDAS